MSKSPGLSYAAVAFDCDKKSLYVIRTCEITDVGDVNKIFDIKTFNPKKKSTYQARWICRSGCIGRRKYKDDDKEFRAVKVLFTGATREEVTERAKEKPPKGLRLRVPNKRTYHSSSNEAEPTPLKKKERGKKRSAPEDQLTFLKRRKAMDTVVNPCVIVDMEEEEDSIVNANDNGKPRVLSNEAVNLDRKTLQSILKPSIDVNPPIEEQIFDTSRSDQISASPSSVNEGAQIAAAINVSSEPNQQVLKNLVNGSPTVPAESPTLVAPSPKQQNASVSPGFNQFVGEGNWPSRSPVDSSYDRRETSEDGQSDLEQGAEQEEAPRARQKFNLVEWRAALIHQAMNSHLTAYEDDDMGETRQRYSSYLQGVYLGCGISMREMPWSIATKRVAKQDTKFVMDVVGEFWPKTMLQRRCIDPSKVSVYKKWKNKTVTQVTPRKVAAVLSIFNDRLHKRGIDRDSRLIELKKVTGIISSKIRNSRKPMPREMPVARQLLFDDQ